MITNDDIILSEAELLIKLIREFIKTPKVEVLSIPSPESNRFENVITLKWDAENIDTVAKRLSKLIEERREIDSTKYNGAILEENG